MGRLFQLIMGGVLFENRSWPELGSGGIKKGVDERVASNR